MKLIPLVADQALQIVLCAHLLVIESSAPFDLPHYLSAREQVDNES